jgi:calcium-dependent protein kinase
MFENKEKGAQAKIIDFGLSKKFSGAPKYMGDRVGTIYTMSPQVIQGIYDSKVDLWSVGVISYMLLCTAKPFYNKSRSKMIELILAGEYRREGVAWDGLSDNARDFVQKLLVVDAKHRMDAAQALKHPWLVEQEQLPDEKPSPEVLASIDNAITSYMHTSALKKLALMVIAHRSTAPAIAELRTVFEQFDSSRDGVISFEELKAAFLQCNFSDEEIQQLFASLVRFSERWCYLASYFSLSCSHSLTPTSSTGHQQERQDQLHRVPCRHD